ncbi:MAG: Sensory box sensor histidine kinase/response regulator [uncultured Sulfurovum sp.]|uniref:histidine kinase n=1 Tax=uncultured Sulfurovum sp. TaxID=269237 RepID=A0A6S6TVD9_9BACT|nr:MAG: Sensory box sensor histidine kinase/response regulator [uncultured Sulfurovum sp.]
MLIENIVSSIEGIPDFKDKEITLQRVERLKKEFNKINKKYQKANEDRLTVSHLLSEVNEELEESLSNEKRFIASVSHELRTPLTAILGYSELLDDTALNNKQKRYLDSMTQSSNHLLSLVSDLLDVAKIGDNRIELSPREIDLDDILIDCANLIRSRIQKDVNFMVDIPMLEYKVLGDDKRIKQIFINLLSNAAKFTKKGSIRFFLQSLAELDNNRIQLVINVDDTGNGIPKEIEEKLFDPFQSTDKTQGTGLGLYISQEISRMMDGEITVESEQGIGSSFKVTLILERSTYKEIGKSLKNANVMMFAERNKFIEKVAKEFINLRVNFQNHDVIKGDVSSSLVQMVASGRFYNVAIFDIDVFKNHTNNIGGTLKTINPNIKLIALVGEENDKDLSEFDLVINKPVSYQRFIKYTEEIYSKEVFDNEEVEDYSSLDILIVEDVELNREYEKEMLDNFFSITCDTAENGAIAVEKARNKSYDAILMDMRMPVMNGLDATRKIREFDTKTPIICMSANVYKEDKLAAEASGMNDFIEKPLDRSDIESKLLKVLKHEFTKENDVNVERKPESVKPVSLDSGEDMRMLALEHLKHNFNDEVANKLFNKATISLKKYVTQIAKNMQEKDKDALLEDFHALKGVLSNIGITDLANLAGELQKMAEKGDLITIAKSKDKLLEAIEKLLEVVEV